MYMWQHVIAHLPQHTRTIKQHLYITESEWHNFLNICKCYVMENFSDEASL